MYIKESSSKRREGKDRGQSGEITDKGHGGSIEVTVVGRTNLPQDDVKVMMPPPIFVDVDSRRNKRTMIKNAYAAATRTKGESSRSPPRRVESSLDQQKATQ